MQHDIPFSSVRSADVSLMSHHIVYKNGGMSTRYLNIQKDLRNSEARLNCYGFTEGRKSDIL